MGGALDDAMSEDSWKKLRRNMERLGLATETEDQALIEGVAQGRYSLEKAALAIFHEHAEYPFWEYSMHDEEPIIILPNGEEVELSSVSMPGPHNLSPDEASQQREELLHRLKKAVADGHLPAYRAGMKTRYIRGNPDYVDEFDAEAYWNDLNAWLSKYEPKATFRFPAPITVDPNSLPDVGNDDTTIQARVRAWNIFTPDWREIRQTGGLQLIALCALSVGLHPWFAQPEWILRVARPFYLGELEDMCCPRPQEGAEYAQLLSDFLERLHVAPTNLQPLGALPAATGVIDGERTYVRVVDFVTWADGMGWTLPAEFSRPGVGAPPNEGEAASVASTGPVKKVGPVWKDQAIALADEYMRGYSGAANPSKSGVIAPAVARMAKDRNITNARGKELTAETIYRDALQSWTPPKLGN